MPKKISTETHTRSKNRFARVFEGLGEECDAPERMHAALHHTEYGATVSCSIRLMLWSGATAANRGAFFSDGWFTSVKLAVAMEKLLPGYSLTGIIKNNSSGFPIAFLRNYCASKSGRIRKAGFNAYMTSTLPNGTKMLAIGHNTEEGATKFLLTTAGDGKLGKDYVQSWISGEGGGGFEGCRPTIAVRNLLPQEWCH